MNTLGTCALDNTPINYHTIINANNGEILDSWNSITPMQPSLCYDNLKEILFYSPITTTTATSSSNYNVQNVPKIIHNVEEGIGYGNYITKVKLYATCNNKTKSYQMIDKERGNSLVVDFSKSKKNNNDLKYVFRDNDNVNSVSSSINSSSKKDEDDGDYNKSSSIAVDVNHATKKSWD